MTQLWAWEYEGKTEFGYELSNRSHDVSRRFVRIDSGTLGFMRDTRFITNLRKAKVVDEDCQDESHTFVNDTCKYCGQNIPVTEPKNFGAIVEAWYESITNKYEKAHFFNNGGNWILRNTLYNFDWSDLINPIIISEGIEG